MTRAPLEHERLEIFGRVMRLELHVDVPIGTNPTRRDAYTTQLEQQVQVRRQESQTMRQESETMR